MTDPDLGPDGEVFTSGADCWAAFAKDFRPSGTQVTVLVDVVAGSIPATAAGLFREIEANYATLLPEIVRSVCSKSSIAPETVERRFHLDSIDLRRHLRPSACVLHYRTHLEFDWYVRVAHDFRIESCGEEN